MKMINESGITTFVFPIDTAVHVGSNSSKLYNSKCILITGLSFVKWQTKDYKFWIQFIVFVLGTCGQQ